MDEREILKIIEGFDKRLPKFPDGRIDYSKSDVAPVISVFVRHGAKMLLLKRSDNVGTYHGKWNTVAGYLDELKPFTKRFWKSLTKNWESRKMRFYQFISENPSGLQIKR